MGLVTMGPPEELVLRLARELSISHFIETGTYRGGTAEWAAGQFARVSTIEAAPAIFDETSRRLAHHNNIEFFQGNSTSHLPVLVESLTSPTMFWLDAHWSGGDTAGATSQCPLLAELAILNGARVPTFLLIDDARLFLSTPKAPEEPSHWPDLTAVVNALQAVDGGRFVVVIDDIFVAVPHEAQGIVMAYCRKRNAALWEQWRRQRTPKWRGAAHLLKENLQGITRDPELALRRIVGTVQDLTRDARRWFDHL